MRIAHLADLHLREASNPYQLTLEEQRNALLRVHQCEPDLILVAGDVFDGPSTPAERNTLGAILTSWALHCPVVVVGGNHDRVGDGELKIFGRLSTERGIHIANIPDEIVIGDAVVHCLPWPRKGWLETAGVGAQDAVSSILRGAGLVIEQCPTHHHILLAHLEVVGASMDSGQPVCSGGLAVDVDTLLDVGFDYCALGHIHRAQSLVRHHVRYAGAPYNTTFGDVGPRGYTVVDLPPGGGSPVIEHRSLGARQMHTLEPDDAGEWAASDRMHELAATHCSIRLKYSTPSSERETARARAEETRDQLMLWGAHAVKIDGRVIPAHRVRSEEIRTARTPEDRLRALWGVTDVPERASEILKKLSSVA